jgi:hypothetical protein
VTPVRSAQSGARQSVFHQRQNLGPGWRQARRLDCAEAERRPRLFRIERRRHPQSLGENGAGRRQRVARHPVDEVAQRVRKTRRAFHRHGSAQLLRRDIAERGAPGDAEKLALAQRRTHHRAARRRAI